MQLAEGQRLEVRTQQSKMLVHLAMKVSDTHLTSFKVRAGVADKEKYREENKVENGAKHQSGSD